MRGKLVKQDENDEPASVLLKKIAAEKAQLIKEKKIKKGKKLPEITEDEIPFEIPDSWEWVRVSEICTKLVDGDHNPPKSLSVKTPFIMASSRNVNHDNLVDLENVRYLDEETFNKENERTNATKGDILFTSVGSLGRTCIYDGSLNICFQRSVSVLTTLINNQFLKYYFDSGYFQKIIMNGATGTAQKGFYLRQLAKSVVPIPPIIEQKRITDKIDELFQQIDAIEQNNKEYEELQQVLKNKLLDLAIRGKLVKQDTDDEPASVLLEKIAAEKAQLIKEKKIKKGKKLPEITKDEIPFKIPDSWEWVRFGNILNIVSAKRVHKSDWKHEGIPFYRAREIAKLADNGYVNNELYISPSLYDEFSMFGVPRPGDLMVTGVGTLGKTYIVQNKDKFYYKDASVLCFENYAKISSNFIKLVMESSLIKNQIKSNSYGTTVATLTISRANHYLLPLPPLAEQKRIVNKLEKLFNVLS